MIGHKHTTEAVNSDQEIRVVGEHCSAAEGVLRGMLEELQTKM